LTSIEGVIRRPAHVLGYAILLLIDRYPPFRLGAQASAREISNRALPTPRTTGGAVLRMESVRVEVIACRGRHAADSSHATTQTLSRDLDRAP
jgi:hypothetical protein